jgi:hypothetical protein
VYSRSNLSVDESPTSDDGEGYLETKNRFRNGGSQHMSAARAVDTMESKMGSITKDGKALTRHFGDEPFPHNLT